MSVDVSLITSVLACAVAVYSCFRNGRHSDIKDVESRTADVIRLEVKIDTLITSNDDIKSELKSQRENSNAMNTRLVAVEESAKQAHKRIDELVKR